MSPLRLVGDISLVIHYSETVILAKYTMKVCCFSSNLHCMCIQIFFSLFEGGRCGAVLQGAASSVSP